MPRSTQRSTFLEWKYGANFEKLGSTEEIHRVVEETNGKKLPITSHDIDKMVDRRFRRKW
jgi:hypothetical protein